jgi:hypothetical protein
MISKRKIKENITCLNCNKELTRIQNKFCCKSCAAIYNNAHKDWSKIKTGPAPKPKIIGPYSTVYFNTCAKTGLIFCSKSYQKFHPTVYADKQHYSWLCKFTFSISKYPLWFKGDIIEQYGWYSTPGSRKGILNTNGVSRDHMISVSYGYVNNIDPKIISHPANCKLLRHKDNQSKKTKCSITLDGLLLLIKDFELLYPI